MQRCAACQELRDLEESRPKALPHFPELKSSEGKYYIASQCLCVKDLCGTFTWRVGKCFPFCTGRNLRQLAYFGTSALDEVQ